MTEKVGPRVRISVIDNGVGMTKEEILKKFSVLEGRVFDSRNLEYAKEEIRRYYISQGRYGVRVNTEIVDEKRNMGVV